MNIADIIEQAQGGQNIQMLARRFGLSEAQTRAAIGQLVPAVEAGIRRETTSANGLEGLLGALANGNHARYLDGDEAGIVEDGNGILGHIFGSKDVSRGVAANAAQTSGIGDGILKQMLPVIAAMVMGALTKSLTGQRQGAAPTGGGLGDLLGSVLGGQGQQGGGLGDLLGGVLGGGRAGQASGGGLGDLLGSVLGGGAQQSGGGINISDVLGSVFGANADPEVRSQATRRAGSALDGILGGGSERGTRADDLLSELTRRLR